MDTVLSFGGLLGSGTPEPPPPPPPTGIWAYLPESFSSSTASPSSSSSSSLSSSSSSSLSSSSSSSVCGSPLNSIVLDFYLWDYAKLHSAEMASFPIHRTRSIYY
mmetsp:Transcript_44738/g.112774  ORF Transcript_44738/g.112774 Transcript_44738/m.112774 type:complete len:105 (+) Transcript_44738:210-524(+)